MSDTQQRLEQLLATEPLAVLSTSHDGAPYASLVAIAALEPGNRPGEQNSAYGLLRPLSRFTTQPDVSPTSPYQNAERIVNDPYCEISFSEKVRIFSSDYLKCCTYISSLQAPGYVFTKKLYSKLIGTSQVLEDFLDFHGAKNSEDWYLYRELCAAVRHLSLGAYCQKHILNRLIFYDIPDTEKFRQQGEATLSFLNDTLRNLAPVIIDESSRLNIAMPEGNFGSEDFPGITMVPIGAEAGGHRGTFAGDWRESLIGTFALVPQVVDAVREQLAFNRKVGNTIGTDSANHGLRITVMRHRIPLVVSQRHVDVALQVDDLITK